MDKSLPKPEDIKLIVTDVDGTILNDKCKLSSTTKDVVRKILKKYPNIPFVIATGKSINGTLMLRDDLGLDENIMTKEEYENYEKTLENKFQKRIPSPTICANGCVIYDGFKEITSQICLTTEELLKSLDLIDNFFTGLNVDYEIAFYVGSYTYFNAEKYYSKRIRDDFKEPIRILPREALLEKVHNNTLKINKLCIFSKVEAITSFRAELIKFTENNSSLIYAQGDPYCIDIMPLLGNKGQGIKLLKKLLDISSEHILCFGDGNNDLTMFDESKYGIAMGNAIEALKNKACYITKSNAEDGVAYALEKIFLS
ncbi:hypothetical protein BCR32DRAFT_233024 [Anaeromyces robustus]|uniref:HAD-like protein n=1 Tax=Anaeromyces robustus TaxID=1754192 RepID=A0A1Y1X5X2_9FUNG|nr:hypothetical protein BCR32DRAFT_233024 [Anaeromyces robustus]|eukprot:ORX81058.1 hypothetical protein BCR32DRAFT_233024 [Anaeromyces robustus]